ncbi:MAG: hypothetical protein U0354_06795 [Candidatus Sericytochromatia bacterium]
MKTQKNLVLALSTILISSTVGCTNTISNTAPNTNPAVTADSKKDLAKPDKASKEEELNLDSFELETEDDSGIKNPISPEDIDYLELNGTKIMSKDIVIATSKSDLTKGVLRFGGAGIYYFTPTKENKDILNVKFKKSNIVATIPILKPSFSIKATATNGYFFTGVGGTGLTFIIKNGNPVYVAGKNGNSSFIIDMEKNTFSYSNGTNEKTFSLNDIISKDSPTGTSITEATKVQLEAIKKQVDKGAKVSLYPYIGVWKLNLFSYYGGLPLIFTIRRTAVDAFSITSIINNNTISTTGKYDNKQEKLDSISFEQTFGKESFKAKVAIVSENNLTLTIISAEGETLKSFVGTPIPLTRKLD